MRRFFPRKLPLQFVVVMAILQACDQNRVYDDYVDLDNSVWHVDTLPSYEFSIDDASLSYPIYYNVRYALGYPFYNLYLTYYLEDSAANIIDTELQELILFDRKTGTPLGDGLGDIFDHQVKVFPSYQFPHKGKYTLKVKQFMRVEELPGIMSFGLRVERPGE